MVLSKRKFIALENPEMFVCPFNVANFMPTMTGLEISISPLA
jgi:hypothetical protein